MKNYSSYTPFSISLNLTLNTIDFSHFPSYSQVIVEYPLAVLISCTILLFACSLAGILSGPLPDFSDPLSVSSLSPY